MIIIVYIIYIIYIYFIRYGVPFRRQHSLRHDIWKRTNGKIYERKGYNEAFSLHKTLAIFNQIGENARKLY